MVWPVLARDTSCKYILIYMCTPMFHKAIYIAQLSQDFFFYLVFLKFDNITLFSILFCMGMMKCKCAVQNAQLNFSVKFWSACWVSVLPMYTYRKLFTFLSCTARTSNWRLLGEKVQNTFLIDMPHFSHFNFFPNLNKSESSQIFRVKTISI